MYFYWPVESNAIRREHKYCISLASTGNGDKQLLFSLCPLLHTIFCLSWSSCLCHFSGMDTSCGPKKATSFLIYSIISSEPALVLPPSSLSLISLFQKRTRFRNNSPAAKRNDSCERSDRLSRVLSVVVIPAVIFSSLQVKRKRLAV